ncbi:response regulator transcription factor [Streptomyces sp. NPDC058217]|uniref:response regulator transcription factor n=1 Tax=Streptomyces sp. NPDC058217 TaxID=3346384 RepID=UPI0036E0AF6D
MTGLSPQQLLIVELAANGQTDQQIASLLGISIHTVRDYWRYRIRPALGAIDRTHAVALAIATGLVPGDRVHTSKGAVVA